VDSRAQTSVEYLLLVAGTVLLVILVGYYLVSSARSTYQDVNSISKG